MSKVFCYRNLRYRNNVVWSVKDCKTQLVVAHKSYIIFQDVELKVSQAGRARVLREQKKYVHAGVKGVIIDREPECVWVPAHYNPYKMDGFTDFMGRPVKKAKYAKLTEAGLFVSLDSGYIYE